MTTSREPLTSSEAAAALLEGAGYVPSEEIATALFLAWSLEKPLLLEGPAGVGKTELAKATARALGLELVRLQCYEGLDDARTLYEWKYGKQLLYTQLLRAQIDELVGSSQDLKQAVDRLAQEDDAFFSETFLEPRPLLRAIRSESQVVLLIDEVDRAEEELEAFFLEVLAEYQVTVPELGTVRATVPPLVFLTSNDTRELSPALRRRCLHLSLDYPSPEREAQILRAQAPELAPELLAAVTDFVSRVRELDLRKTPSISESIDWARSLLILSAGELGEESVRRSLGSLLKHRGDREVVLSQLDKLV